MPPFWDAIATKELTLPSDLEARQTSGRETLKAMERRLRPRASMAWLMVTTPWQPMKSTVAQLGFSAGTGSPSAFT